MGVATGVPPYLPTGWPIHSLGPLHPLFLILAADPGLRPSQAGRQRDDWIRGDPVVPGARGHLELDALYTDG